MKVTKEQLKQLISEEIKNVLSEDDGRYFVKGDPEDNYGYGGALGPEKAAQQKTPPTAAADKGGSLQDEIDDLKTAVKDVLAKLDEL